MGGEEASYVAEAFRTNWLSTVGPNLAAFEQEFSRLVGLPALAVSSGTAALHLALRLAGVTSGDDVICSTFTFVAAPNAIQYLGARPVFIDSDYKTWNLDPALLADALKDGKQRPRAVCVVHLYGQSADMDPILEVCRRYDVAVVEDAAEAVGTLYRDRHAGTWGETAAYSFNGNKIITTTGGGMLVAQTAELVEKARFWSTQARDPGTTYHHSEMGYNYRLSNVLAGIGRGQLKVLHERVHRRREIAFRYRDSLRGYPGIALMPQAEYGLHTNWLSCFTIDAETFGGSRDDLIAALDAADIEARPLWKPMHLQPLYADCPRIGGGVAEDLFRRGLCLPSSSSLTDGEQDRVIEAIASFHGKRRWRHAAAD